MRSVGETLKNPRELGRSIFAGLLIVVVTAAAGVASSLEGTLSGGMASISILFAGGAMLVYGLERSRPGYLAVEMPVLLILFSTLTLRYSFAGGPQSTAELTENPFDIFSLLQLGCTGVAAALGLLALTERKRPGERVSSRPVRLYAMYAGVVVLGLVTSVNPLLTGYRAIEVMASLLVVTGAYRASGTDALRRIENLVFWYFVVMATTAWIGAVVFPGIALEHINSPIPLRLTGALPHISSNTIGTFGCMIALWSLARLLAKDREWGPRPAVSGLLIGYGLVTLVIAQYRTGYAMFVAGLALLLLLAGRKTLGTLAVICILAIAALGGGIFQDAQPYVLRGQDTERASRLSGRVTYWSAAIPVWKQSPIIGGGLETASRLLVLDDLDTEKGSASNLHSTWVEALVGTGAVGLLALVLSLLTAWGRSLRRAFDGASRIVPAVLLSALLIRSLTGGTIQGGGDLLLLFLTLAIGLRDRDFPNKRRPSGPPLPDGRVVAIRP
ncbi:MAG: O-antigen ligase family protein [Actinobacteria bacterium]|nr:O-antigen ligase family protein [Actinomycetota bacterium]